MGNLTPFKLDELIEKYDIDIYIETGLGVGETLLYANQYNFEKLYSCEIDKATYDYTIAQHNIPNNVEIYQEKSITYLQNIINNLHNKRCLFFLDSHFPGELFFKDSNDFNKEKTESVKYPLLDELYFIINNRDVSHDILIIDDARLYIKKLPKINDVKTIIRPSDEYLQAMYDMLKALQVTHQVKIHLQDQGYIVMFPIS